MEAGIAWADGSLFKENTDDEFVKALRKFDAPPDILREALLEASPVIEIWPENYDTFQLFLRLSSQWNIVSGMSKAFRTGLKYESVEALMSIENIPNKAAVFRDIQTIEFAALSVLNGGDS